MKNIISSFVLFAAASLAVAQPQRVPGPIFVQPLGISSNSVYDMIVNYNIASTNGINSTTASNIVSQNAILKLDGNGTNTTLTGLRANGITNLSGNRFIQSTPGVQVEVFEPLTETAVLVADDQSTALRVGGTIVFGGLEDSTYVTAPNSTNRLTVGEVYNTFTGGVEITSSAGLHVNGQIHNTNLTASLPVFTDANKGLVSTTIDLIAGSGMTVTTNTANRVWTLASTGGAALEYSNNQDVFTVTGNDSVTLNSSSGADLTVWNATAGQLDIDIGGASLVANSGGWQLDAPGATETFEVSTSGIRPTSSAISVSTLLGVDGSGYLQSVTSISTLDVTTLHATNIITLITNAPFLKTDANSKIAYTADGGSLTNLTLNLQTNAINTGVIPVGKTTFTNIAGNITIGGFSSVDFNYNQWAKLWVTNSTATDYTVTLPASVCTATNAFVIAQAVWVTNKSAVTISVDVSAWGTNAAAVRFQR